MYRKLRHRVLSTIMVAVLAAQQLFGAYHVLTKHVDDCTYGVNEAQEMVSTVEAQCELCAKLDSKPATFHLEMEPVFYAFHFSANPELQEGTLLSTRPDAIYLRGPPIAH